MKPEASSGSPLRVQRQSASVVSLRLPSSIRRELGGQWSAQARLQLTFKRVHAATAALDRLHHGCNPNLRVAISRHWNCFHPGSYQNAPNGSHTSVDVAVPAPQSNRRSTWQQGPPLLLRLCSRPKQDRDRRKSITPAHQEDNSRMFVQMLGFSSQPLSIGHTRITGIRARI